MVETTVLHPGTGRIVTAPGSPLRFLVESRLTHGRFSVVEQSLEPRALAWPVHTHRLEDEFAYVADGEVGALVDGETVEAGKGSMLFLPRDVPHALWNRSDAPARVVAIFAPSGIEGLFADLAGRFAPDTPGDDEALQLAMVELGRKYAVDFDMPTLAELAALHNLRF